MAQGSLKTLLAKSLMSWHKQDNAGCFSMSFFFRSFVSFINVIRFIAYMSITSFRNAINMMCIICFSLYRDYIQIPSIVNGTRA